ncbi:hypothetical protein ETR14_27370 (plasmid) [Sphingosinicella sp. BN140058]|nr:hypothetical protein ETR14_27370 [Sphingosinicella sp. BN140058]
MTITPSAITAGTTNPKVKGSEPKSYSRIAASVATARRTRAQTVMMFGAVNDKIAPLLSIGQPLRVLVAYDQAPAQGQNARGGQCMRIVGLPRTRIAQAA